MLRASSLGLHVQHGLKRKLLSKPCHSWTRKRRKSAIAFHSSDSASSLPSISANVVDHRTKGVLHGIFLTQQKSAVDQSTLSLLKSVSNSNVAGEEEGKVEGEDKQLVLKGKRPMETGFPQKVTCRQELESLETTAVDEGSKDELTAENDYLQDQFLIDRARSIKEAWGAYERLLAREEEHIEAGNVNDVLFIRQKTLYKLSRLLASSKPHTRETFLRLLAVLSRVRKRGGTIKLWQWNALIDCAGKGWRRTTVDEYKNALSIFNEMTASNSGGQRRHQTLLAPLAGQSFNPVEPDIITYTTLLNIASNTKDPTAMRHAHSLLNSSNLPADEVAHLSTLAFEVHHNGMSGARQVFDDIRSKGFENNMNSINAFLSVCMREGRISSAEEIYEALLLHEEGRSGNDSGDEGTADLDGRTVEGLYIPTSLFPDFITHTIMVQGFAYHGYLLESLNALDLLFLALKREEGKEATNEERDGDTGDIIDVYRRILPAFRGLFLGFKRHGQSPRKSSLFSHTLSRKRFPWDETNLNTVLDTFFNLPEGLVLKESMVYWALMALQRVTDRDEEKMKSLLMRLQDHFVFKESSRLQYLRSMLS